MTDKYIPPSAAEQLEAQLGSGHETWEQIAMMWHRAAQEGCDFLKYIARQTSEPAHALECVQATVAASERKTEEFRLRGQEVAVDADTGAAMLLLLKSASQLQWKAIANEWSNAAHAAVGFLQGLVDGKVLAELAVSDMIRRTDRCRDLEKARGAMERAVIDAMSAVGPQGDTEVLVRALETLAFRGIGKSGAEEVPDFVSAANGKLQDLKSKGFRVTGYAIEGPGVEGRPGEPRYGFINAGALVGWWRPHGDGGRQVVPAEYLPSPVVH